MVIIPRCDRGDTSSILVYHPKNMKNIEEQVDNLQDVIKKYSSTINPSEELNKMLLELINISTKMKAICTTSKNDSVGEGSNPFVPTK